MEYANPGINAGELLIRAEIWDESGNTGSYVTVRFDEVCGIRVLSESDVLDFHKKYNFADGWLFEIFADGWIAQESSRPGFLSQHVPFYREFLFEDAENFVSVISKAAPSVEFT